MINKKAFTLIELMVVLLIFTIILSGVYGAFTIAGSLYQIDTASVNIQQQARQAMNWLVKDLRASSTGSISISYGGPGLDVVTFDTPFGTNIQYYVTAGQLIREYPVGTTRAIANNISTLDFILSVNTLKITLVCSATALKRPLSIQLIEKVTLRN
ncbi:MAG: prepilin-type N-terminal cleavage/methylation domain-containing protein [Candidatus Omnitrophica bacterium]|nr:prepilin-type N-terminal cleavage/methylation domain-containing protein [Candidatus Omnitrophota bacterium]